MKKKLLLLGVGSALMFTMGGVGPAQADAGPHISTVVGAGATATMGQAGGDRCAGCHRAHTAKAEYLLKAAQPALCFSCHDGTGASTDVVDGKGAAGAGLRGGGFSYALINGATASKTMGTTPSSHGGYAIDSEIVPVVAAGGPLVPGTAVTSKHDISGTTAGTMWGNGAISATTADPGKSGVTLECGSCHDPHGNGNYRILKPIPNDAGTLVQTTISAASTSSTGVVTPAELSAPATGVNIPDATEKNYTTANYWLVTDRNVPNVKGVALATTETDGYITNVSQWCSTCHTRYLAGSGSWNTNSGDKVFTYRHRSNRNNSAGISRPNCIQCHVSHGSNVTMGGSATKVPFPGAAATEGGEAVTTSADSRLLRVNDRGVCVMCHNV